MRQLIVLSSLVGVLAAVGTAGAGGWATVSLEALPAGVSSGDTWNAQLMVLRHGVTPTDGAAPSLTIRKGSQIETFAAESTGKTGGYEARVVFPEPGEWMLEIDNGLVATGYGVSETTTLGPVTITSGPAGTPSSFPVLPATVIVAALGLIGVSVLGVRRLRRLSPASE